MTALAPFSRTGRDDLPRTGRPLMRGTAPLITPRSATVRTRAERKRYGRSPPGRLFAWVMRDLYEAWARAYRRVHGGRSRRAKDDSPIEANGSGRVPSPDLKDTSTGLAAASSPKRRPRDAAAPLGLDDRARADLDDQ